MTPRPDAKRYRMPPEWAPHEATWLAWPHDTTTWAKGLNAAEESYRAMIRALAPGERVELLVPDAQTRQRVRTLLEADGLDVSEAKRPPHQASKDAGVVRIHVRAYVDSWLRDTGPTIVQADTGSRVAIDWRFDAWGGKYEELKQDDVLAGFIADRLGLERVRVETVLEGGAFDVDGGGRVLTTEACLLNPNRGPDRTRGRMEGLLATYLGAEEVLWLGEGIAGDDTDGHVDDVARFVGPGQIVAARAKEGSQDHAVLEANWRRLQAYAEASEQGLEVVELPVPEPVVFEGQRLPASYANFYIGNEVVLLPVYGVGKDEEAAGVLRSAFPKRRIVEIEAEPLVVGFGACHCLTQQVPA